MNARLQLRTAVLTFRRGGSRGWLALGAVALGITSMMIMLALAAGAEREMRKVVDQLGKNLFAISPARVSGANGRFTSTRLRMSDVPLLRAQVPEIAAVVPIVERSTLVRFGPESVVTSVRGVPPDYAAVRNFTLAEGRLLDDADGATRNRVAVLGSSVAERLLAAPGDTLRIGSAPFDVVGILEEKGLADGQNEDDQVLVPFETAERRLFNVDGITRLLVQTRDPGDIPVAQERARDVLRASHRLPEGARDDFEILSLVRVNEIRRLNSEFMNGLAQLFALITLVIGGAGVLVVTFLNVRERTPEIGLRMAVGARARDIAGLFVAEACALSAAGGVCGLLLGVLAVLLFERLLGWQMTIVPRGILIPLATSVLLGATFSIVPAVRAAHVMPVEALRDS